MRREEIIDLCDREVLDPAARLFGTVKDALVLREGHQGCQNLVYEYERNGLPLILRVSYRPDRSIGRIEAELDFVTYLADNGVRVCRPLPSQNGHLVESILAAGILFILVSFTKAKGTRVPDNGYRYRDGAPIEEYFRNWGQMLGRMHELASEYRPARNLSERPEWPEVSGCMGIDEQFPSELAVVRDRFTALLAQINGLPKSRDSYGMIHGDFNDGNITVDYENGDLTIFDFDDSCEFYFMHELAGAWLSGTGWVMHRELAQRESFMAHYYNEVLEGYGREHVLSSEWLERLPLFLKVLEMELLLNALRDADRADGNARAALDYRIECVERDIPYLGFFDSIYTPVRPFSM